MLAAGKPEQLGRVSVMASTVFLARSAPRQAREEGSVCHPPEFLQIGESHASV